MPPIAITSPSITGSPVVGSTLTGNDALFGGLGQDSSSNLRNGTLVGGGAAPTFDAVNKVFGAGSIAISAGGWVSYGDIIPGSTAYTVECWFKRSRTGVFEVLLSKHQSSSAGSLFYLAISSTNKLILGHFTSAGVGQQAAVQTPLLTDTNWHHAVGVWSGSNIGVALDGIWATPIAAAAIAPNSQALPLLVGNSADGGSQFVGNIDEVRISNTTIYTIGVNFTPPAAQLTSAPQTVLLAHWQPPASISARKWQRSTDGGVTWNDIAGATSAVYTLAAADGGQSVRYADTAVDVEGSIDIESAALAVTQPPPPVNVVSPTISGIPTVGQVLTCSTGSWSYSPTVYAFQWERDGSQISGEVDSTYTVQPGDVNHGLSCRVTATNSVGPTSVTSAPLSVYAPLTPPIQSFAYTSPVSGLTGLLALEIVSLQDGATVAVRSTQFIAEVKPGSGIYRAQRSQLPSGQYLLLWDEGSQAAGQVVVDFVEVP